MTAKTSQSQFPTDAASTGDARVPLDVIVITYNERLNLPHNLKSVARWARRVFVVDSGSVDGTQELARGMGAEVVEHAWEGYAAQKNWALDHLPLESPWTLIIDADEVVTAELREEITGIVCRPVEEVGEDGFYINRYLVFMGQRIRFCGYNPSWNLRLFKRGKARYEDRPVHEHMVLNGREGYLRGLLEHQDRRGLEYYVAKHNRYSTLEAEAIFFGAQGENSVVKPALFGNAVSRRRFLKSRVWPLLPAKWLGRFVWMYFVRLGFLDGMGGLRFCLLLAFHELMTTLKYRELQLRARSLPSPAEAEALRTTKVQLAIPTPRATREGR